MRIVIWHTRAGTTATKLSEGALVPTPAAVISISPNIAAMRLAAVQEALPLVGRHTVTHIVGVPVIAMRALFNAGQEPASQSRVVKWCVEDVFILSVVFEVGREGGGSEE